MVKSDYPLKEAIMSIEPLCDEIVIAVGKSDDNTLEYVRNIPTPKIRIVETLWDESLRQGGRVLSVETNKALDAINPKADWCCYIQADECMHEQDHAAIIQSMQQWKDHPEVEGLVFDYLHFYGTYDFIADSRSWYRREARIIRNRKDIRSYGDAQGFRVGDRKINAKLAGARVFHYGWVKHPALQQKKQEEARRWWHDDDFIREKVAVADVFDYSGFDSLRRFQGTHPAVMHDRVRQVTWQLNADPEAKKMGLKKRFLYELEKLTGWRPGEFRNYKLL